MTKSSYVDISKISNQLIISLIPFCIKSKCNNKNNFRKFPVNIQTILNSEKIRNS